MNNLQVSINWLRDECYSASKTAGWWTDINTGEPIDPHSRFTEKIALIHSEVSECLEGFRKDLPDDKLPHRKMAEVELADAIIRIMDLCGAMNYDIGGAIIEKMSFNANRPDHKIENRKLENGKKF